MFPSHDQGEIGLQNTVSLVVPNNEETVQEESTQPTVTHEKRNHGQNITYPGEPLTITLPGDGARQPDPPSPPGADTSCCSGTMSCCESPGAGCRQPVSQIPVTRVGDSDLEVEETTESTAGFPEITSEDEYLGITTLDEPSSIEETEESKAVTEEEYLGIETKEEESKAVTEEESKAVTEEEYLGIEEDTPSIIEEPVDTTEEPSIIRPAFINVTNNSELKAALGNTDVINVLENITLTEFTYIPKNTTIRGINNPIIESTAGAAFNIREDNITLTGFTLKNAEDNNGYGIEIGRKPNRNSLDAPKNITIDSITFDGIAGSTDKATAINVSGYQFVSTLVEPIRDVPGLRS